MRNEFYDKKVVVMGLGLHGGGLSVAKWFFSQGSHVVVTDLKTNKDLETSVKALTQFCARYRLSHSTQRLHSIEYALGGHRDQDFIDADLIVQNPDVRSISPYLELARENAIPIENEASLFFLMTKGTPKIGITGTKGKSITASLLYHIARAHDLKTTIAGNIRTIALFDIIDDIIRREEKEDFHPVILELSSWQLELLENKRLSPNIAIVTNVLEDHLNRYEGMEDYGRAKQHVYKHQTENNYVILNFDNDITRDWGNKGTPGGLIWFSRERKNMGDGVFVRDAGTGEKEVAFRKGEDIETVCFVSDLALPGVHNIYNSLGAIAAAKILGISNESIRDSLRTFHGVSDRLEKITFIKGRSIYNDTTATTPDATLAALRTLSPRNAKNIVLIAGGADKKLDYHGLAPVINKVVHSIVLLSGTATPKLGSELNAIRYKGKVEMANSMNEAVGKAWRHTREGDIMLLSPGAASFGMFLHEFDRGDKFREAITHLQDEIQ